MSGLVCIAGGGTGGHVMPALALADALRQHWQGLKVNFIGAERGLEATLLPERNESVLLLNMHAVQGAGWWQRLRVVCWELPCSILQILVLWRRERPSVLVGVGGYASVAGVMAALLARIPVVLYEQNAIPGLVNRQLYRFCDVMMLGFATAEQHMPSRRKTVVTGNVIRREIVEIHYQPQQKPCLLVVGGSQGAMFLNETVPAACGLLAEQKKNFTVIHVVGAGKGRVEAVAKMYQEAGVEAAVYAYAKDMQQLFAKSDLLMARSGAMTVCEAAAIGMPAIFVPLPWAADNHQYFNAKTLVDVGAAYMVEQDACNVKMLAKQLSETLLDVKELKQMHEKSAAVFIQDAAQQQVQVLSRYLAEVTS